MKKPSVSKNPQIFLVGMQAESLSGLRLRMDDDDWVLIE
jgi:hypothetical protein